MDILFGVETPEGKWMALKRRDSRFIQKYGPLFEVNRGPPMYYTDMTYEKDPETGYCYRGRLQQANEAPIVSIRCTCYTFPPAIFLACISEMLTNQ